MQWRDMDHYSWGTGTARLNTILFNHITFPLFSLWFSVFYLQLHPFPSMHWINASGTGPILSPSGPYIYAFKALHVRLKQHSAFWLWGVSLWRNSGFDMALIVLVWITPTLAGVSEWQFPFHRSLISRGLQVCAAASDLASAEWGPGLSLSPLCDTPDMSVEKDSVDSFRLGIL